MADGIVELCIIFDMPISKIPIPIYQGTEQSIFVV